VGPFWALRMPRGGPLLGAHFQVGSSMIFTRRRMPRRWSRWSRVDTQRGYTIEIEDGEWGWTYLLDNERYGEPLEMVFKEIDERSGSSEEEIESLAVAWAAHLEVRR
jgi:hypothetical protein